MDTALERAVKTNVGDDWVPRLGFTFTELKSATGDGDGDEAQPGDVGETGDGKGSAAGGGQSSTTDGSQGKGGDGAAGADGDRSAAEAGTGGAGSSSGAGSSNDDQQSSATGSMSMDITISSVESASSSDAADANARSMFATVPVYTVIVSSDGSISEAKGNTASLYSGARDVVVAAALAQGGQSGELAKYGLYYRIGDTIGGSTRVAFADVSELRNDVLQSTVGLLAGWLALMAAIAVVSFFLSRYVSRPVARAWEDQQRFIADASHELKTPLTVMLADTSILQASPDKTVAEQRAWVESIEVEATRMQQLTEDMLTLAQADAGVELTQVMADVDLSSAVQGVALQFEAVAFERGLELSSTVEDGLHVTGDARKLESLTKTLLENACKYAAQPGRVDLRLARAKGAAVLSVHNDGDPVPAEDLPHLFDRFYRSDKARTSEGSSASFGLGLSIAKATVEAHGGTIGVASDASGTTFTAKIPLAKARGK